MNNSSTNQKVMFDNLLAENTKMVQVIAQLRQDKEQMGKHLRKAETYTKTADLKLKTIQNQRQRDLNDKRNLIESLETHKKERVKFMTDLLEVKNLLSRKEAQIHSIKIKNQELKTQNEQFQNERQREQKNLIATKKEDQNMLNKVKILQSKLQASDSQKNFLMNKISQIEKQSQRVKKQLSDLNKKYQQKELGVQCIYRDEQGTKQRLLQEFQSKILDKDLEMKNEIQKYLNENCMLKHQLIQLRTGIRN